LRNIVVFLIPVILFCGDFCFGADDLADSQCGFQYAQWRNAFENLNRSAEELQNAKREAVADKITTQLQEQGKGVPIARAVQEVLKQRNLNVQSAAEVCQKNAEIERDFFEQLRRCAADTRGRGQNGLAGIQKNRSVLLAQIPDLLLDEAYSQYKREQPNPQYTGRNDPNGTFTRNTGYGGYNQYYGYR
jgi:hypothetical protein